MRTLLNKGTRAVHFPIQKFSFFGLEGQYWMLIVSGLVVAFSFFAWKTRDRD
jgi:hypothetical protein